MTRDEILEVITQVLGDELTVLRDDLEARIDRSIASKPLPPFAPPPVWTAGRHGVTTSVRQVNGLFVAVRDTEQEPPGEDWLPLVVGVAGIDLCFSNERTVALRARLSDGSDYEMVRTLAVPIVRGYWSADADYDEGDRVFRFGEFHALKASKGIEPGTVGTEDTWLKVGGKQKREAPQFALDQDGTLTELGRVVGTIKPLVREVLNEIAARYAHK